MPEKKILFAATVAKKHICQFHLQYLKWFADRGYEVHVCAADDFEEGDDHVVPYCSRFFNIPFSRSPFSPKNADAYCRLRKIINENSYELICCHTPVAAAVVRLAAARSGRNGTKVLYTAHGFHFFKGAPAVSIIYKLAETFLCRFTDGIITVNHEDLAAAVKMCRGTKCRPYLIHGIGAAVEDIINTPDVRSVMRRQLGIPEGAFAVMTTAEINRNKNITSGIRAFAAAAEKGGDMYYIICGSGDMLEQCRELALELGVSDRVIFTGYRHDVPQLLRAADVFLFPSYREGLGIAAVEAMAAGLPLVASDIRGVREYAVSGENSLLYAPDDIQGFADAISLLERDDELRRRLGENAVKAALPFDIHNSVEEMAEIYRQFADIPEPERVTL